MDETRTRPEDAHFPAVVLDGGLHMRGTALWLDATARRAMTFVSNAGLPRPGRHEKVVCTDQTAHLIRAMGGRVRALSGPYGHRVQLGPLPIDLVPSGHMLGGAQLLTEVDGCRVLYTGTICTEPLPTARPLEPRPVDLVIAQAVCAPPGASIPSRRAGAEALLTAVDDSLHAGHPAVLFVDSPGVAQDVLKLLCDAGVHARAQRSIHRATLAYRSLELRFPGLRRFSRTLAPDEVLVYPWSGLRAKEVARFAGATRLRVSLDAPSPQDALALDGTIPYGNLSTSPALLGYLRGLGAQRVVLHGPHDRHLAQHLARSGVEAVALSAQGQLSLFSGETSEAR